MNRDRVSFGQRVPLLLVLVATVGLAYEALLLFTSVLAPYRFPIPFAVPLFDIPFVLVATGIAYLCLERHRIRQDFQSAAMGTSLFPGHALGDWPHPDAAGLPVQPRCEPGDRPPSLLRELPGRPDWRRPWHTVRRSPAPAHRPQPDDRDPRLRRVERPHRGHGPDRGSAPAVAGDAAGAAHAIRRVERGCRQRRRGGVGAVGLATWTQPASDVAGIREPPRAGRVRLASRAHRIPAVPLPVRSELVRGRPGASVRCRRALRRSAPRAGVALSRGAKPPARPGTAPRGQPGACNHARARCRPSGLRPALAGSGERAGHPGRRGRDGQAAAARRRRRVVAGRRGGRLRLAAR